MKKADMYSRLSVAGLVAAAACFCVAIACLLLAGCVSAKQDLATGPKPAAQSASAPVVKRPMLKAVGSLDVAPAPAKPAK